MWVVYFVVCIVNSCIPLMPVLYFRLGWFSFWFHDTLHWNVIGNNPIKHEVCGKCRYCGKEITHDSSDE